MRKKLTISSLRVSKKTAPSVKLPINLPYSDSACKKGSLTSEPQSHRHATSSKDHLVNNAMKIEQKQMKKHLPATFNFSDTKYS